MADTRIGANFTIDITKLQAGLATANKLIRESQSEFKAAAAGLDDWTQSEDGLKAKIKSLNDIIDIQREKVKKLNENYQNQLAKGLDETSDRAIYLRTQINKEEAALKNNEAELKKNTESLENLGKQAKNTGDDIENSGGAWQKFGDAAKTACAVAVGAIAAVSAAVVALTKQAVESYADYEQLIGGVETLFGAGGKSLEEYAESVGKSVDEAKAEYDRLMQAQNTMIENANNAYKTAGMSANDYMQNVTSFSASLISSLGGDTVLAAEAADRAITDMADNANKMGTSIDSIIDTYQSLAKGQTRTLANLKLGYGSSTEELERLISDASEMTDIQQELNVSVKKGDRSFSNIVNAISVVQQKMGITGTTMKEASSTITGSLSSVKSAWKNMLTGIADDTQDFDGLVNNLVESIETAAKNLLPRIATALEGIIKLVENFVPRIPALIEEFLPIIIKGIMNVVKGVVKILPDVLDTLLKIVPDLIDALIDMIPDILDAMATIIAKIISAIAKALPKIVNAIMKIIPQIVKALAKAFPQLLKAAIELLMAIVKAIPTVVKELTKMLPEIITTIINTLLGSIDLIIDAAIELLMGIVEAIPEVITALVEALPKIIDSIVNTLFSEENFAKIIDGAIKLLMGILDAIPKIILALVENLPKIIDAIVSSLLDPDNFQKVLNGAVELLSALVAAIPQVLEMLIENLPQIIVTMVDSLEKGVENMFDVGVDLIEGLWDGMVSVFNWLGEQLEDLLGTLLDDICVFFGINSPSKVFADKVGKNMALGIGVGFKNTIGKVSDDIRNSLRPFDSMSLGINGQVGYGRGVVVNQVNNYAQAHSRYEIYQSKQEAAAAVRLALETI